MKKIKDREKWKDFSLETYMEPDSKAIYQLWINDKVYIGSSVSLVKRIQSHLSMLRNGNHTQTVQSHFDSIKKEDLNFRIKYVRFRGTPEGLKKKEHRNIALYAGHDILLNYFLVEPNKPGVSPIRNNQVSQILPNKYPNEKRYARRRKDFLEAHDWDPKTSTWIKKVS